MGRLTTGLIIVCVLSAKTASAEEKSCASDITAAHKARAEGKLKASLDALKKCASADCTEHSCAKEWVEVEALTPSVVVIVRDAKGHDYANAPVIVDGALAESVDGHSIFVDPGMHTFRVGAFDGIPTEQHIFVHEHEKNRVVLFFAEPIAFSVQPVSTPAPAQPSKH